MKKRFDPTTRYGARGHTRGAALPRRLDDAQQLALACNAYAIHEVTVKTATFPAIRVEPELRQAAEDLLDQDETLSSFMEARRTGEYFDADEVHADLAQMLAAAKRGEGGH